MKWLSAVKRSQLLIALYCLLGLLLLWGGLKLIFGVSFGPLVDEVLPNGVIVGAVLIFGWNRWLLDQEAKKKDAEEAADAGESPKDK